MSKTKVAKQRSKALEKLTDAVYTAAFDCFEAGAALDDVHYAVDEALENWGEVDEVRRKKQVTKASHGGAL